jgi:hypothetical protein
LAAHDDAVASLSCCQPEVTRIDRHRPSGMQR